MKLSCVMLILFGLCLSAAAAEEGFKRYQLIIDKRPFGDEPIDETAPVQVAPQQSFARDLRLSMLFEGPGGDLRAGVINTKLNKSYILKIGEIEDSIELVEANIATSEALLQKGNEVALLKLEEGKAEPQKKAAAPAKGNSYAQRREALLQRVQEQKQKEEPQQPALTGEALRKHLEEVQMNAIREGMPPLPLPLTPEMDAQLVEEGFLPPQ